MVCHHLDRNILEDLRFAESRIRAETVAAEDVLLDTGAISMISSDSQAMGRVGEVVARTWRTASKLKLNRGPLTELGDTHECDNGRVKRYIAKYTINPCVSKRIGRMCTGHFLIMMFSLAIVRSRMASARTLDRSKWAKSPTSFFGNLRTLARNRRWCSSRALSCGPRYVPAFFLVPFRYAIAVD
jgi:hypothetical protein